MASSFFTWMTVRCQPVMKLTCLNSSKPCLKRHLSGKNLLSSIWDVVFMKGCTAYVWFRGFMEILFVVLFIVAYRDIDS